jgi:hypothetical protein
MDKLTLGFLILAVQIPIAFLPNTKASNIYLKLFSCFVGLLYMAYCVSES